MREPRRLMEEAGASPVTLTPEGLRLSQETDRNIDQMVLATFGNQTTSGPAVLNWMESFTTRRALGPDAANRQLRHLEGARWLVNVIKARLQRARENPLP